MPGMRDHDGRNAQLHQRVVTHPLMLIPTHRTEVLWLVANLPALTFVFIFMSISLLNRPAAGIRGYIQ